MTPENKITEQFKEELKQEIDKLTEIDSKSYCHHSMACLIIATAFFEDYPDPAICKTLEAILIKTLPEAARGYAMMKSEQN